MRQPVLTAFIVATTIVLTLSATAAQQILPVRVDRGLQVRSLMGQVLRMQSHHSSPAKIGDFLSAIGDGISTREASSALLRVDTGIGFVDVSESTNLVIQELSVAPDQGRITRLLVSQGQARLRLRPFKNRGSKLEIRTPVGISGVRGTEFGVAVQPNGKTGLAVLQGQVESSAQARSLIVDRGFQNFTMPGEPPSTPVPLRDDTRLTYSFERVIQGGVRKIQLSGQVDPVNSVFVNQRPQVTDRNGRFTAALEIFPPPLFRVVVRTPLGKEQQYSVMYQ